FLGYGSAYGYGSNSYYYDVGYYSLNYFPRIRMPILPVQSVASITYVDINGAPQTLDPANYALKLYKDPPEIWWTGQVPGIKPASDITINLVAGYTATDVLNSVPQLIKTAIKFIATAWWEQRVPVSEALVRAVPLSYERVI